MKARLIAAFERLGARERRVVTIGGLAAIAIVIVLVLLPLQASVSAAGQRIAHKREDLAWLTAMAPQLGALGEAATPAAPHESLVVLVDRTARDAGIGKALVGSQPGGDGGLNVHFKGVPFDTLVAWLSQIGQRYGVQAASASIDAAGSPGTVDATMVLRTR
jgi:type II secretory pathway component PulM